MNKAVVFLLAVVCTLLDSPVRPQTCSDYEKYVLFEKCLAGLGDFVPDIRTELDSSVCCPSKSVIGDIFEEQSLTLCSDVAGFACLPISICGNRNIASTDLRDSLKVVVNNVTSTRQLEYNTGSRLCQSDLEICCNVTEGGSDDPFGEIFGTPTTSKIQSTEAPLPTAKTTSDAIKHKPICGRHNAQGIDIRISSSVEGDKTTQFGEWPHMCVLYEEVILKNEIKARKFRGGASLIAPGMVLTAAHKVYGTNHSNLLVRCGDWDLNLGVEPRRHQDRRVSRAIIHPSFNWPKLVYNDVALLDLEGDFELDGHIGTICLPDHESLEDFDSQSCFATGWGKDAFGERGKYQQALKKVEIDLVDHKECQNNLRKTEKIPDDFILHDSFLCAGGKDKKDTCEGDGGGPLVCPAKSESRKGRYVQAGIISWGVGCGQEGIPGVYASVPKALCFIDWATKCFHQDKFNDFYNIQGCENWPDKELARLELVLTSLESALEKASFTMVQKLILQKNINETKSYIQNVKDLSRSCGTNEPFIAHFSKRVEDSVFSTLE